MAPFWEAKGLKMEPFWITFGVLRGPMVAIKSTPEEKWRVLSDVGSLLASFLTLKLYEKHGKNTLEIRRGKM